MDVETAKIFCVRSSKGLAKKMAKEFGVEMAKVAFSKYSDGEFQPSLEETVRGHRAFIIGSIHPPSRNLMELLLLIDAAKRASAQKITVVIPYFGWARQDRKDKPRVPIASKLIANLLSTAGTTRIITMDLHADQIQGFFEIPVDHLYSSSIFIPHLKSMGLDNLTVASPDMGGAKRAHAYAKFLDCDVVICYKERKKANVINKMMLIGDVKDRNVILVDDLVDTAGTLIYASNVLMENEAKSVRAVCTHGLFSSKALERIENSSIKELFITDSITKKITSDKIKILSCAPLFGEVMKNVHNHFSISSNFLYQK